MTEPFTPGRDDQPMRKRPITDNMSAAVTHPSFDSRTSDLHLLRDCLTLGSPSRRRRTPAKVRLEEALGPDLAQRLLTSLSAKGRR